MRIGVVLPEDPESPAAWSGTPRGLVNGLREAGADVVPIDITPPSLVTRAVVAGVYRAGRVPDGFSAADVREWSAYANLLSATAAVRLPRRLDAVLQIGAGYRVRHRLVGSFEDMTIAQAVRHDWGMWARYPGREYQQRLQLQKRVYETARVCFTSTAWAASSIVEDYGILAGKTLAVGLGVNRSVRHQGRQEWGQPRFLFVGHDWARKGGPAVVEAFREVRQHIPSARLDLVGAGVPPISSAGVTVHGSIPIGDAAGQQRLGVLFETSTCLVVPSRLEPAGIVYAEAGQAGMPSIGTTVGGAREMIGPGGLLVQPGRHGELVAAMLRMSEPATAQAFGRLAAAHAESLTWKKVGQRILERFRVESARR